MYNMTARWSLRLRHWLTKYLNMESTFHNIAINSHNHIPAKAAVNILENNDKSILISVL